MEREAAPTRGDGRRAAAEWLRLVRDAEQRGETLAVVDLAERGLAEHPGSLELKHGAVLGLARSGSTTEAARRFADYGLADIENEEIGSLGARIAKDQALAEGAPRREQLAQRAARAYEAVYAGSGGYYPAINAATMRLLAGDRAGAEQLARAVLRILRQKKPDYFSIASEAEAQLILGDLVAAREAVEAAASAHAGDYGALTTTRRQLKTVCAEIGADPRLLDPLTGPTVAHYCGHRIAPLEGEGRFPADQEGAIADRMAEEVRRHRAGFAYGSLASGGDILWAEALLSQGCDLHVVLPFALEEFVRCSVEPSGLEWVERFHRCIAAAREVRFATDDAYLGDDVLFRYGSELAMGLALLRARYLDAEAVQLALWDGQAAAGAAGTALDVEAWRRNGRPAAIIAPATTSPDRSPTRPVDPDGAPSGRVVRALLFGDIRGFSRLTDEEVTGFANHVLSAFARVLDNHSATVEHRNSWGDALYVVLKDPAAAATCALDLQAGMLGVDLEASGLPGGLALRLGAHVGPVFPTQDPVIGRLAFMGSHVSRTARIEPVTPPGTVYVSEQFAAALNLAGRDEFSCDYVGHMPAAKGFGRLRMYSLGRRSAAPSANLIAE